MFFALSIIEITTLSHISSYYHCPLGSDEMKTIKDNGFYVLDNVCLNIYVNGLGLAVVVVAFLVLMFLDTETSLFG